MALFGIGNKKNKTPKVTREERREREKRQGEQLDILIPAFQRDSDHRVSLPEYPTLGQKRATLRALMNERPPRHMDPEILQIQDAYLQDRAKERVIVEYDQIRTLKEVKSHVPHADRLSLWQGDITRLHIGAIVDATTNKTMLGCFTPGHECLDNAIHSFAGIELRMECDRQMARKRALWGKNYEEPRGSAMLTPGFNLPCDYILHTRGPHVHRGMRVTEEDRQTLASSYRSCLDLAAKNGIRSVAFCCISTGTYRFPSDEAAKIAVETVSAWLDEHGAEMDRVLFCVLRDEDRNAYLDILF